MFGIYNYGVIIVYEKKRKFSVKGARLGSAPHHGMASKAMAVMTLGTSKIAEKAADNFVRSAVSTLNFSFDDLISYDIDIDNSTVMSGGVGRAIVGDVLAGPVGAIVGVASRKSKDMCNSMTLVIHLSDKRHPLVTVPLIEKPVKRRSSAYKNAASTAQESIAGLDLIANGGFDK